jgi:hypothetical protein
MRGGKGKGGKAKLEAFTVATEDMISNLEPMAWTRERTAYDLISHK